MSDPTDNPPRGVTNLRIKFRSASLDEFIARYAVDVSRGGIFIRTREPLSVGSRLKLDFQLLDAAPLLDGEGTVVWIRKPDPARPEVAPGMGVRFDRLSPESDERLAQILAAKERLGQTGKVLGMSGTGGGMAVRRPTGAFPTVDPSVAPSTSPSEPAAGSTEGDPKGSAAERPRPSSTFATLARPAAGFGRPRPSTGGVSPLRSAPVPSSVFEPPTADDIDKALAVLEDKAGPIPTPQPPSANVAEPPSPVSDEGSNEPTRVAERIEDGERGDEDAEDDSAANEFDSDDAVTETRGAVLPESGAPDAPGSAVDDLTVPADLLAVEAAERARNPEAHEAAEDEDDEATLAASPAAFATAEKVLGDLTSPRDAVAGTASAGPSSEGPSAPGDSLEGTSPSLAAVGAKSPFAKSPPTGEKVSAGEPGLFRADENYERPRKGVKWAIALLVLAAIGAGGYALRGRSGTPTRPQETASGAAGAASPEANKGVGLTDAGAAANTVAATVDGSAAAAPTEAKTAATEPGAHTKDHKPAESPPPGNPAAAEETRPKRKRTHAAASASAGEPGAETAGTPGDQAKPTGGQAAERGETKPSGERGEAAGGASASTAAANSEPAAPASPTLRIVSAPSGAEVVIDGTSVGKTPLSIKDVDTSTTHALLLKKDGYEPAERAVSSADWTQSKSGATAKLTVKLRRVGADAPKDDSKKDGKPDVEIITPD